jgi:hypothetical protein
VPIVHIVVKIRETRLKLNPASKNSQKNLKTRKFSGKIGQIFWQKTGNFKKNYLLKPLFWTNFKKNSKKIFIIFNLLTANKSLL